MGVVFDCPAVAKRLPEQTETDLSHNAYRVKLDHNCLVWVTQENGREVRYTSEPKASEMKKIMSTVISWLPIEWLF